MSSLENLKSIVLAEEKALLERRKRRIESLDDDKSKYTLLPPIWLVDWDSKKINFNYNKVIGDVLTFSSNPSVDVLTYAARVNELDKVMGELTRNICASSCPDAPAGCCNGQFHKYTDFKAILNLQENEANINAWVICEEDPNLCKYHTNTGCKLTLLKSPLCLGYLCAEIDIELTMKNPNETTSVFLNAMDKVAHSKLEYYERVFEGNFKGRDDILDAMDVAIVYGRDLIRKS